MSKQPPPPLTASAVGPCPTVIQIVRRPGTGSLPSTIAPPDHPRFSHLLILSRNGRTKIYDVSVPSGPPVHRNQPHLSIFFNANLVEYANKCQVDLMN